MLAVRKASCLALLFGATAVFTIISLTAAVPLLQNPALPNVDHDAIILPAEGNDTSLPLVTSLNTSSSNDPSSSLLLNSSRAEFLKLNSSSSPFSPFTSLDLSNSSFPLGEVNATEVAGLNGTGLPLPELRHLQKAPTIAKRPLAPPPVIDTGRSQCRRSHATLFWSYSPPESAEGDYPASNSAAAATVPDHYIIYKRNNHPDRANSTGWEPFDFRRKVTEHQLALPNTLKPNTPYSFRLEAVFRGGRRSRPSVPFNCTTFIDVPVRHPQFISAYSLAGEPNSVLVKWRPLEMSDRGADGASYTVYIRKEGEEEEGGNLQIRGDQILEPGQTELVSQSLVVKRVVTQAGQGELLIKDSQLVAGQRYTVSVEARNPLGVSKAPLIEHEIHFQEERPTAVPARLNVTKVVDGNTATFSWAPVPVESVNGNFKGWGEGEGV